MQLGNVAVVRSGLVLARKQSREPSKYRYPLLNLRSVNSAGYVDINTVDIFDAVDLLESEYLTQNSDVVIRLSAPYTAILIDEETSGMVISSNFAVIRADQKIILPEYLFWLLNTANVKRQIFENTSSNMLGATKPKFFSEFEIAPPPLDKQYNIAMLNQLARRECHLLTKLAKEKERYYTLIIDKAQSEMRRGKEHDNEK